MKIVIALFQVLCIGYINCSVTHENIIHTKRDRKHVEKIVHALLKKHKTGNARIDQARQNVKIKDAYFSWYQDSALKRLYVDMWLAYDVINQETQKKERVEEFLQDSFFTKKEMRDLKICSFYKKRLQSKS